MKQAVIECLDADSIYKIPAMLHDQMLDEIVCRQARHPTAGRLTSIWNGLVEALTHPEQQPGHRLRRQVRRPDRILQVADRGADPPASSRMPGSIRYLDSETSERRLRRADRRRCVLVSRRFRPAWHRRQRSPRSATPARTKVPHLGICLGMQLAVIEFAATSPGPGANSTEFERDGLHPLVGLITEWKDVSGKTEKRGEDSDLGGTMRLGAQSRPVKPGTLARNHGRNHRAPPPSLRSQQQLLAQLEAAGRVVRRAMDREPVRDGRTADRGPSVVRRLPVPSGIHLQPAYRPSAVHRFTSGGAGHQQQWRLKFGQMKLCGLTSAHRPPLFLIAGPVRHRILELCVDTAGS